MLYLPLLISIVEVLIVTVPVLLTVAFVTVAERKTMASMQRRLGPNIVGYYGLLQVFADALKFLLKKYVSPTQANSILFFLGSIITLIFSLLGFSVVPYGPGLAISDFNLGILYMLAVSSLSTYGILLAGWSANSKYSFLGSLSSPPKPHAFISMPVQSSLNFRLINKTSLLLLTAFFILAFRWPIKAIFGQLDMLAYYPIANTFISLGLAYFVTAVSLKKLSNFKIASIIIIGAVLPLSVLFITKNIDNLCLCIGALIHLYTLFTMLFSPIKLGSISFASAADQNIGSSSGAGIGSSSGAGVGSSTAANVDSTSLRDEIDEDRRAKQEELDRATRNLANLRLEQHLKLKTAGLMENAKRGIEEFCRKNSKSAEFKAESIKDMEDYFTQQLDIEIEAEKLRQIAGNAPHANTWRDELDAPGTLLKKVHDDGVHDCDELNKAKRKNIYREARNAIKYEAPPKDMLENSTLKKHLGYLNVLARIELEQAALDVAKSRHPEAVSEKKVTENKASLNLAKLLITNRLGYRTSKYNTQDRETCENNVSYLGDTYYRSQDQSKNNVRWPANHDHDNNNDVD